MNNETQKKVTPPSWMDELLSVKELAARLGYSERYIRAMKRDGFRMPGRRASVREALHWLEKHPDFRVNRKKSDKKKSADNGQTDIDEFYKDGIRCKGSM